MLFDFHIQRLWFLSYKLCLVVERLKDLENVNIIITNFFFDSCVVYPLLLHNEGYLVALFDQVLDLVSNKIMNRFTFIYC